MSTEILSKLKSLRLELETLKLHGHKYVEGCLETGWIERLKVKEQVASKRTGEAEKDMGTESLKSIETKVKSCEKCELSKSRTNIVFGVGNKNARLMFIGEAPGAEEDKQGEPFVGRAGKLLTKMINAMGFERGDVYIANILKCRPPDNRNPLPAEVEKCEAYLVSQIKAIKPEVICSLGAVSSQTLLKTETAISKLRGEFHEYHGTPLLPTYHPAYLLRNPSAKTETWKDLKLVLKKLGMPAPKSDG